MRSRLANESGPGALARHELEPGLKQMSDLGTIRLLGLRTHGHHGVLASERESGQEFIIDIEIDIPFPENDRLAETVDYASLAEDVAAWVADDPVDLIETLAARIADGILPRISHGEVRVSVHKPAAPISVPFADISVTCRRYKQ